MFLEEKSIYGLKAFLDGYLLGLPAFNDTHQFVNAFAAYVGGDTSTCNSRSWAKILRWRAHDKYSALPLAIDLMQDFHWNNDSGTSLCSEESNFTSGSSQTGFELPESGVPLQWPSFLQKIRLAPSSALDETSIRSLRAFLTGFELASSGTTAVSRFLCAFDAFIVNRYPLPLNLSWNQRIEIHSQDAHTAMTDAFQLMDEFVALSHTNGSSGIG